MDAVDILFLKVRNVTWKLLENKINTLSALIYLIRNVRGVARIVLNYI